MSLDPKGILFVELFVTVFTQTESVLIELLDELEDRLDELKELDVELVSGLVFELGFVVEDLVDELLDEFGLFPIVMTVIPEDGTTGVGVDEVKELALDEEDETIAGEITAGLGNKLIPTLATGLSKSFPVESGVTAE